MHLLIYIILILAIAALWQLVRVVELSARLKGIDPNKVTESDNRMNGRFMMIFYIALMIFFFWQMKEYGSRMLPVSASEHGIEIDWLLNFNWVIICTVFVVTNFLLFYMGWKYYGRDGQRATYYPHNNKLEMLWTGVPAVVLFIIIFFGIKIWNNTMGRAPKNSRVIELYAQQFNWTARYSGADNQLGKANYRLINENNNLGLDTTDSFVNDDILVTDTIFLPVNQEVDFRMRSRDVIHSAYFPHFRAQMNVVPGMETYFHFKPIYTTAEMRMQPSTIKLMKGINDVRIAAGNEKVEFNYLLLCNKICGVSHFNMQLLIYVGTDAEYKEWMKRHKPFFTPSSSKVAVNN